MFIAIGDRLINLAQIIEINLDADFEDFFGVQSSQTSIRSCVKIVTCELLIGSSNRSYFYFNEVAEDIKFWLRNAENETMQFINFVSAKEVKELDAYMNEVQEIQESQNQPPGESLDIPW